MAGKNDPVIIRDFAPDPPNELRARVRSVLSLWLTEAPPTPSATMLPNDFPEDNGQENSRRDHPRLDRQAA